MAQGCCTIKTLTHIPKTHPRLESLLVRERLVKGFECGLVAVEGLLAEGRGEAFDYLLGEKTSRAAKKATRAAAAQLLLAKRPVISVNGNTAALCAKDVVNLAKVANAGIEVNLFYANKKRKQNIALVLRNNGATQVLGTGKKMKQLPGIDSSRRMVDKDGIFSADVVVVSLEDGDRTWALKKSGKNVITFDLNPLSRTATSADITIVDNITRAMALLAEYCKKMSGRNTKSLEGIVTRYDNKKNLADSIIEIRKHLARRARIA